MIRIDLSRDELEQSSKPSFAGKIISIFKSGGPSGNKTYADFKTFMIVAIVVVMSVFPLLFVIQYKSYVRKGYEKQIADLTAKSTELKEAIVKLEPYRRELGSYEQQKIVVETRLKAVRKLMSLRSTPVAVLDALGQSLPLRVWLEQLEYRIQPGQVVPGQPPKEPISVVSIKGLSYANEDISDYVEKLGESIYLRDIQLQKVESRKIGQFDTKQFSVLAVSQDPLVSATHPVSENERPK